MILDVDYRPSLYSVITVIFTFIACCNIHLSISFIFCLQDKDGASGESNLFPHVQSLRNFPIENIYGEVVIVRFDSTLLLEASDSNNFSLDKSLFTIKYLFNAGAKVLLVSNWGRLDHPMLLSVESLAGH